MDIMKCSFQLSILLRKLFLFSKTACTFIGIGESSHLQPFWMGFAKKKWGSPLPWCFSVPFLQKDIGGKHFQGQNPMNAACIQKRKNICSYFFPLGGTEFVGGGRGMMMGGKYGHQLAVLVWNANYRATYLPLLDLIAGVMKSNSFIMWPGSHRWIHS